jgi:hypothetical protein
MKKIIEFFKWLWIKFWGAKEIETPVLTDTEIQEVKREIIPITKKPEVLKHSHNPKGTKPKDHHKSIIWQKEKARAKK